MGDIVEMDDSNEGSMEQLKPQQTEAIEYLLAGDSYRDIAKKLDVDKNTISNWVNKDPNFQQVLNDRKSELRKEIGGRLQGLNNEAVDLLKLAQQKAYEQAEMNNDYAPALDVAVEVLKATGTHGEAMKEIFQEYVEQQREKNDEIEQLIEKLKREYSEEELRKKLHVLKSM